MEPVRQKGLRVTFNEESIQRIQRDRKIEKHLRQSSANFELKLIKNYNITRLPDTHKICKTFNVSTLIDRYFGALNHNNFDVTDCNYHLHYLFFCKRNLLFVNNKEEAINQASRIFQNTYLDTNNDLITDLSGSEEETKKGIILLIYLFVCLKERDCKLHEDYCSRSRESAFIEKLYFYFKSFFPDLQLEKIMNSYSHEKENKFYFAYDKIQENQKLLPIFLQKEQQKEQEENIQSKNFRGTNDVLFSDMPSNSSDIANMPTSNNSDEGGESSVYYTSNSSIAQDDVEGLWMNRT